MQTRTTGVDESERVETTDATQQDGGNGAAETGNARHADAPTFTRADIETGDRPQSMEKAADKPRFLYYYYDADTGRITLTGFVSASSRRDARRRLRMKGLRA